MKGNLKTVSEVCNLTGLSRKDLYEFETAVPPSDRYGHNSKGKGYKLYNNEAVIKLYQISIFRNLGIPRKKIKETITSKNYDANTVLKSQIAILTEQKQKTEQLIAAAQELLSVGIDDTLNEEIPKISIPHLGEIIHMWSVGGIYEQIEHFIDARHKDASKEQILFDDLLNQFLSLKKESLHTYQADSILNNLLESGIQALHIFSIIKLAGIGYSIQGRGSAFTQLRETYGSQIDAAHGVKLLTYLGSRMEEQFRLFLNEMSAITDKYSNFIYSDVSQDFSHPVVREMTASIKEICRNRLFIEEKIEYEICINGIGMILKADTSLMKDLCMDSELHQTASYIIRALSYNS